MSRLALYFLGTPRLERDGVPVEVDTRKATALMAYLAVTRREHGRDTLAALLWPEYDQQHARGALRRTLSVLRQGLGPEWFSAGTETIGLAWGAGPWVDVEQFLRAVAAGRPATGGSRPVRDHGGPDPEPVARLAAAAELYRGDFLAGFSLRDSPDFDEWQFMQSEGLRRDLGNILEQLVQACAAADDLDRAIAYARRWLALDPLHEPVHRTLMQLYAAAGRRSAALRQYQECERILQQELGVAPLEETTRVYQEIKTLPRMGAGGRAPAAESTRARAQAQPPDEDRPGTEAPAGLSSSQGRAEVVAAGRPGMAPYPLRAGRAGGGGRLPLAGRAAEWARLDRALAAARDAGQLIALEGEAGIGKTRLAEDFLSHAAGLGAPAIVIRCYQGEAGLAYAPFVAALRAAAGLQESRPGALARVAAAALGEAARLLPALAPPAGPDAAPLPPLDGPGAQARFFDGVGQVLAAALSAGSAAAGLLFFDDVQWLDAASLDLLTYLARRLPGSRPGTPWRGLCLLLAWRSDEVGAGHPLRRLLAEAQRGGYATHIVLGRLAPAALAELVEAAAAQDRVALSRPTPGAEARPAGQASPAYGSRPAPARPGVPNPLAARLYHETEGLPFFLVEYLTALANGTLGAANGDWVTPGGVRDLIEARLAAVSGAGRQLLSTAAVIGRSFDFETLREASGRTEEEAVAGLEELLAQGLVREIADPDAGPAYDFAHQKLCEVAYTETSLARRRLLHRRVAEILAGRTPDPAGSAGVPGPAPGNGTADGGPLGAGRAPHRRPSGGPASLIAQHYAVAGQPLAAARYYVAAGSYARQLYANVEALGHFRAALALGYPDAAFLHEAIGDLQTLSGDYGAGLESYKAALSLAGDPSSGEVPGSAQANLEHKLGMLHLRRGAWDQAACHLQAALAAWGEAGPPSWRSHLYADWSLAAQRLGHAGEAHELAEHAYDLAAQAEDRHALAQAENALGMLARKQGDAAAAQRHLEASLALAEALGDPVLRAAALNNLALACAETGAYERAITLTRLALELVQILGDRHREAALHNNLADLWHAHGDHEAAMVHLKQAVSIFAEIRTEADTLQPEIWKLSEW